MANVSCVERPPFVHISAFMKAAVKSLCGSLYSQVFMSFLVTSPEQDFLGHLVSTHTKKPSKYLGMQYCLYFTSSV